MVSPASPLSRSLTLRPGESISDGRLDQAVCRVRNGWVLSSFSDTDGQRQVTGVLLGGDLRWSTPGDEAAEMTALTPAVVELIPLSVLHETARVQGAHVLTGFYEEAQSLLLDQVRLLSGRSGRLKVERLIDTLRKRTVRMTGPRPDGVVSLPLTRPVLADILGMTERHVSRVLKDMEREGLIALRRGVIQVTPAMVPA